MPQAPDDDQGDGSDAAPGQGQQVPQGPGGQGPGGQGNFQDFFNRFFGGQGPGWRR